MARKIKKLPDGVVLIHYSKNGKIVSDLKLEDWYSNLVSIIIRTRKINKTLIVKVGTENMVHATRELVLKDILHPDQIRYKYGRRVFRIDDKGQWIGIPGKQYPENFLGLTDKIRSKISTCSAEYVTPVSESIKFNPGKYLKNYAFVDDALMTASIKNMYIEKKTAEDMYQKEMEMSMLKPKYFGEGAVPLPHPLKIPYPWDSSSEPNPYYPNSPKWVEFEKNKSIKDPPETEEQALTMEEIKKTYAILSGIIDKKSTTE